MMGRDVAVKVYNFTQLRTHELPLRLDNYQRPYVWGSKRVGQLLDDLAAFSREDGLGQYYMGTVLLHRDERKKGLFVIDGQQRLSTLAVLYHHFHNKVPSGIRFSYRSSTSVLNLQAAQEQVRQVADLGFGRSIFSKLRFTVIIVEREDQAFTFFDTQNNRGVPLKATDLLKAYHLRAIENGKANEVERLQGGVCKTLGGCPEAG